MDSSFHGNDGKLNSPEVYFDLPSAFLLTTLWLALDLFAVSVIVSGVPWMVTYYG